MRRLQGLLRCFVLSVGLSFIRPDEIEEMMYLAHRPKLAWVVRIDEESGEGPEP